MAGRHTTSPGVARPTGRQDARDSGAPMDGGRRNVEVRRRRVLHPARAARSSPVSCAICARAGDFFAARPPAAARLHRVDRIGTGPAGEDSARAKRPRGSRGPTRYARQPANGLRTTPYPHQINFFFFSPINHTEPNCICKKLNQTKTTVFFNQNQTEP